MTTTDAPPILAGRTVDEIRTLLEDATDEQAVIIGEALALVALEDDWRTWLTSLFPEYFPFDFAPHHAQFWDWLWAIDESKPRPFVGVWARGGAKSTSVEAGVVALAAMNRRRYVLYVCDKQDQADKHVANIGGLLERPRFGECYPLCAQRKLNKFGSPRGWRRNQLQTASGFTVEAYGLDVAARGVKVDEVRPDVIVFDDIDSHEDAPNTIEDKIANITMKLLPTGKGDSVVIAIQNLMHKDGVFARMVDGRADYLHGRVMSGPIPAVRDLVVHDRGGMEADRWQVVSGVPTWEGQSLEVVEGQMNEWGYTGFMSEAQHNVEAPPGGMFDHVRFDRCTRDEYDELKATNQILDVAVWVDPAVTNKDSSDSQGLQVDAVGVDGSLYRVRSWEQRSSPLDAIKKAITWGIDEGATKVGVETDQGRDTWLSVYRQALDELRDEGFIHDLTVIPSFAQAQAGTTQQSKAARLAHMLADYERANSRIVHVEGTHHILEAALVRFPKTKPYDLADAAYWAWRYFRPGGAHSAVSHAGAVAAAGSLPSRTEVFAMGRRR